MIIRTRKDKNFTTICNIPLHDSKLSFKARGLMAYMLSFPNDWDFSISMLVASNEKDKETSIKSAIKELEKEGYLIRKYSKTSDGKFGKAEYILLESPPMENPSVENPLAENQGLLNTIITKDYNNQILYKQNKKNIIKENFELFWSAYPKKQAKAKTEQWFTKNNPNEELMQIILSKLEQFKRTKQWKEKNGQYIPLPTTWLNGKRWEDEIAECDIEQTKEEHDAEVLRIAEEELRREEQEKNDSRRIEEDYY